VLALRGMVMFPGILTRLSVGRPASLLALREAIDADKRLVLVSQRNATVDAPAPDDLYDVGVTVAIQGTRDRQDGRAVGVLVHGMARCRILEYTSQEPFLQARVEAYPDAPGDVPADLMKRVRELMRVGEDPAQAEALLEALPDEVGVDLMMAFGLDMPVADKQMLLEAPSREERYRMLVPVLEVEVQIAKAGERIRSRYALSQRQRREYLEGRQKELEGELKELTGEGADTDELSRRIDEADLPEDALQEARRELDRLRRIPPGSGEYSVAEDYLDWLLALPWHAATDAPVDLTEARRVLNGDHYDRDEVKERILEYLSVRKLRPSRQGALLCLVGAPGVGKTSLGRSVAEATGRVFQRIALGGTRDEAEIRGHRRTYIGALPGRIIRALRKAGVNNPVIQLDEIDKLGRGPMGAPTSALLEVLDPEQNAAFVDSYLAVPFDLSRIMFIATANTTATIPPVLLDRLEVMELPGYSTDEKLAIAERFLVPKQLAATGLDAECVEFTPDALELLVEEYTREAGVRGLEREIASLCRKMARDYISGRCCYRLVNAGLVGDLLGPPKYHRVRSERIGKPGVCPTLAVTGAGAELLLVEVLKVEGSGRLIVTGRVGEVLGESAQLVYSFFKASGAGLDASSIASSDFHIHFPGGGRPTEGASAGLPMALAFASALSGECLPEATAALGEVTLHGRLLPVDYLRERLAGAERAGIQRVLLPEANRAEAVAAQKAGRTAGVGLTFVCSLQEAVSLLLPTAQAAPASR